MMATIPDQPIEVGSVLADTFDLISDRWPIVFGIALLVALPLRLIGLVFENWRSQNWNGFTLGYTANPHSLLALVVSAVTAVLILSVLIGAFGRAAMVGVATAQRARSRIGFWETLRPALAQLPAVFLIALLALISILLGLLLLIVPGILLAILWSVAVPVAITERTGIVGAFKRSAQLTAGTRWRVLLLLIATNLITLIFSAVGKGAVMLFVNMLSDGSRFGVATGPGSFAALTFLDMLTFTVTLTVPCILYIHLAERHGGPTSDRLTRIFE